MSKIFSLEKAYDDAAPLWQKKLRHLDVPKAYEDFVSRAMPNAHVDSIVDVGTGCGDLAAAACDVLGNPQKLVLIDSSANMLSYAKPRFACRDIDTECWHGDMFKIATRPKADLVLAGHVIEHCADPILAIKQLGDFLKPQGTLLLVVSKPHWCNWLIWLRWRHRWYKPEQIEAWAKFMGFAQVETFSMRYGALQRTSAGFRLKK
jgi:ubiquinone/menaquinone biosynthesis C-methylase UbiE